MTVGWPGAMHNLLGLFMTVRDVDTVVDRCNHVLPKFLGMVRLSDNIGTFEYLPTSFLKF